MSTQAAAKQTPVWIEPLCPDESDVAPAERLIQRVIRNCEYYSDDAQAGMAAPYTREAIHDAALYGTLFVARNRSGRIVGFASTESFPGGLAFLHWIGVAPECRGQGIGRALLEHVKVHYAAAGAHKLSAQVLTTNAPSLGLMEAAGLVKVALLQRHWYRQDYYLVSTPLGDTAEAGR